MIELKVNDYTELIQLVIYLADVKDKTRQNIGNRFYCDAIDRHFEKFRNHAAVVATRELICNRHFNYSRPHVAALRFPELVNGNEELSEWAKLMLKFQEETNFPSFFSGLSGYYDAILEKIRNCPLAEWTDYIEEYFHCSGDLCLIICPLDGNYGFHLDQTAYVIRCEPYYSENGEIPFVASALAKGIAHEYAHCFVNPVVEEDKALLKKYAAFFDRHKNMASFYNVDYAVMNEYWVRAFAIRFMEHMDFPDFEIEEEFRRQRTMFPYIDRFVDAWKDYECSKNRFQEFYFTNLHHVICESMK